MTVAIRVVIGHWSGNLSKLYTPQCTICIEQRTIELRTVVPIESIIDRPQQNQLIKSSNTLTLLTFSISMIMHNEQISTEPKSKYYCKLYLLLPINAKCGLLLDKEKAAIQSHVRITKIISDRANKFDAIEILPMI